MSRKHSRISEWVRPFERGKQNAYLLAFVDFFNKGKYYEAHEILEVIWLPARKTGDDAFYKGLIQLAGAFVHLQKERPEPGLALLRLAKANLSSFADGHHGVELAAALKMIEHWEANIRDCIGNQFPISLKKAPMLLIKNAIPSSG